MPNATRMLLAGAAALGLVSTAHAADVPGFAASQHVLLISVDGMHEVDLRLWIADHKSGALALLSSRGTTYGNALTTAPSDSFPGIIAQTTGGTPKTAGVFYDESYDRTFFAPKNTTCTGSPGAAVAFTEILDKSLADHTGGGTLGQPLTQINTDKLPRRLVDGVCSHVLPHQFVGVNTVFEVIRGHGGHTAWSDKHPAYEILNGPSGQGVEDLFTPEINAQLPGAPSGQDYTTSFAGARTHDEIKVDAVLHQISGFDSTGAVNRGYVPNVFGMNFQAVSVGQKLTKAGYGDLPQTLTGGYADAAGTPGEALSQQLQFVDDSIGRMIGALQTQHVYDNTVVIISAKHGQSPIDKALLRRIPDTYAKVLANDGYGFNVADDAALIWLDPAHRTPALYQQALKSLQAASPALGIQRIATTEELTRTYRDNFTDARTPDFLVVADHGVVYTSKTAKVAEHGGVADDDRHVALLVSAAGLAGDHVDDAVSTTQIAPTILGAFHIAPDELEAVRQEHTQVLPGLARLME